VLVTASIAAIIAINGAADRAQLADPILNPEKRDFTAEELHRLHFHDYRGNVADAYSEKSRSLIGEEVIVTRYFHGPITQSSMIKGETDTGYGISSERGGVILIWCHKAKTKADLESLAAATGSVRRIKGECWSGDSIHRQVTLLNCSVVP
jgi:hypothetical protein